MKSFQTIIIFAGITHHAGRTFAVYAISVSHHRMEGPEEKWFVVRRYSEFYDFHEMLIEKVRYFWELFCHTNSIVAIKFSFFFSISLKFYLYYIIIFKNDVRKTLKNMIFSAIV